ncbi:MAG: thiamine pyrophosphate-binding protein, partial [Clostridium lundense]|nr:thiamine pyrophosphate-binding protein [Clostridium lundense]
MKRRVADIIMDILVEHDIKDCFAVVGGGAMHLDNALALNNQINKVFCHHEQSCSMAAEAYARYSGKMAAVCVTSGPGATNAITGVMGCWQDSLPMFVMSGQVRYETCIEKTGLPLRYRGMQEYNIVPSVKHMTKYAKMLSDPLEVKREVCKAIDIAMNGRRGPVWLDIPMDIQSAIVEEDDMYPVEPKLEVVNPTKEDITFILEKLASAKRPCILVGNGVANSHTIKEFREFAVKTRVPVIAACISADAMYMDYDRYYGLSGSIGPRTGNFIVQNADVILAIGSSLGYKMSGYAQDLFAPKAYMMAVDIDVNEMKKPGVRVDYFVHSDLRAFFDVANAEAKEIAVSKDWVDYCDALKVRFTPFDPANDVADEERVCAYRFWKEYEKFEPEDSITVLGNNSANSAKLQIGIKKENQRLIANNNCGS